MKKNNINTVNFNGYTPIFENCTFGKVNRNLLINPTKGSIKMVGNQWVKSNDIKDNLLLIYAKIPTKDLTKIFYNQVVKVILFIGIIIQNHTEKNGIKNPTKEWSVIDEVFYSYFIDIHKDNIDFKIIYKKQSDPVVQYKGDQVASAKAVPAHSTWLEQSRTSSQYMVGAKPYQLTVHV